MVRPTLRNGKLIRGQRPVGGGGSGETDYAQFGTLVADYDPRNATSSGGRVTLISEPVGGFNATESVAGTGPTLNASNASYNNLPTLDFASGNPISSDRLVTNSGIGSALGNGSVTVCLAINTSAGHTQYVLTSPGNGGFNYTAFYANTTTSFVDMLAGDGGGFGFNMTTVDISSPCAISLVFNTTSMRVKRNQDSVVAATPSTSAYSTDRSGAGFIIGNWVGPSDIYVVEGSIARILFYSGDIGDSNLAAVNAALQAEYGL